MSLPGVRRGSIGATNHGLERVRVRPRRDGDQLREVRQRALHAIGDEPLRPFGDLLAVRVPSLGAHDVMKGDVDRMLTESVTQAQSFGAPPETLDEVRRLCESLKQGYAAAGRIGAVRIMRDFASRNLQPAAAIQLSILSGEMGDLDAGFGHLDRALDSHDPSLVHLAVAPQWDSLRGDPRFGDRLARIGLSTRNAKRA